MSTFPKPRRKGWRFLRKGERLRRGDLFQWDSNSNGRTLFPSGLLAYGSGTRGVPGPNFSNPLDHYGYIRRIAKRRAKK